MTVTDSIASPLLHGLSLSPLCTHSSPSFFAHLASSHVTTLHLTSPRLTTPPCTSLYFISPRHPLLTTPFFAKPYLVSTHLASPHLDLPFHPATVMMDVWLMLLVPTLHAQTRRNEDVTVQVFGIFVTICTNTSHVYMLYSRICSICIRVYSYEKRHRFTNGIQNSSLR